MGGLVAALPAALTTSSVQQLCLNPVAQHELLVARKFVQLRDQIDQQVLQFRQNVVAIGHVNLLKKIPPLRGLVFDLTTPFSMTACVLIQKA